jgi:hypothetical protein
LLKATPMMMSLVMSSLRKIQSHRQAMPKLIDLKP